MIKLKQDNYFRYSLLNKKNRKMFSAPFDYNNND